jgi:hypothetical protein
MDGSCHSPDRKRLLWNATVLVEMEGKNFLLTRYNSASIIFIHNYQNYINDLPGSVISLQYKNLPGQCQWKKISQY